MLFLLLRIRVKSLIAAIILLVFLNSRATSQQPGLLQVRGLPSTEVYNVFPDSRGFIWIGHNLGLSRYDGSNFTSFSSPEQTSLGMTDIIEDATGRIWTHDFNGQIFYVDHEKLILLKQYDNAHEPNFPRIVIYRNYLVATSARGLFVCNCKTLACNYVNSPNNLKGTTSVAVLNDNIIAFGNGKWYRYKIGYPELELLKQRPMLPDVNAVSSLLVPFNYRDTLFQIAYTSGGLNKILIRRDSVILASRIVMNSYINTVSLDGNLVWINSKTKSITLGGKLPVVGYNLTGIATDKEGNTWYGSLKYGLLVRNNSHTFRKMGFREIDTTDFIRDVCSDSHYRVFGSQDGDIIARELPSGRTVYKCHLPANSGAIEFMNSYPGGRFLVGASVGSYLFDPKNKRLDTMSTGMMVKDIDLSDKDIFLGLSDKILVRAITRADRPFNYEENASIKFNTLPINGVHQDEYLAYHQRCRAIRYARERGILYMAFKNGLFGIDGKQIRSVNYKGGAIFASSLAYTNNDLFIATFNNGLLVLSGNHFTHYGLSEGLLSNTIMKISLYGNHLWIIENNGIQLFDLSRHTLQTQLALPQITNAVVYNIYEARDTAYISTSEGLYLAELNTHARPATLRPYFLYALINGSDTLVSEKIKVPYNHNDIQFKLAVPGFNSSNNIYLKYRLKSADQKQWHYSAPGERYIHFASLKPGNYSFEAYAVGADGSYSSSPVTVSLLVEAPWWQRWWFIVLLTGGVLSATILLVRIYYQTVIEKQKIYFERELAIQAEREHIGREIHDDIGQMLAVICLNLNRGGPKQIEESLSLLTKVIKDLRGFSHALYKRRESGGELAYNIQRDLLSIENSELITCKFETCTGITGLSDEQEVITYRIFQEAIGNILKHAEASLILVKLYKSKHQFELIISDNGKGFPPETLSEGVGIKNMKKRAKEMGATLEISTIFGSGCTVSLILAF